MSSSSAVNQSQMSLLEDEVSGARAQSVSSSSQLPSIEEATTYAQNLSFIDSQRQICGCYLMRCVCCFNLPIGCACHYEPCAGCMHTIGSIPFSCCVCMCRDNDSSTNKNVWVNIKGDTKVMMIDESTGKLGCYWVQKTQPFCVCTKICWPDGLYCWVLNKGYIGNQTNQRASRLKPPVIILQVYAAFEVVSVQYDTILMSEM